MSALELIVSPGLETATDWSFESDGAAVAARRTLDPFEGAWHGQVQRVADGAVFGGFRNSAAVVALFNPGAGHEVTVTLQIKRTGSTVVTLEIDTGDGLFDTLIGPFSANSTYALWEPGTFVTTGEGRPQLRIVTVSGGAGSVRFDLVHAITDIPLEAYPDGDMLFQESYTDDLRGTIHKRRDVVRDTQDRRVWNHDLDEPDRDDVLVDWNQPYEREDIEP